MICENTSVMTACNHIPEEKRNALIHGKILRPTPLQNFLLVSRLEPGSQHEMLLPKFARQIHVWGEGVEIPVSHGSSTSTFAHCCDSQNTPNRGVMAVITLRIVVLETPESLTFLEMDAPGRRTPFIIALFKSGRTWVKNVELIPPAKHYVSQTTTPGPPLFSKDELIVGIGKRKDELNGRR
ncbi:hypothetical protein TNCV_4944911 [Trichonephila clavipes]|nr:hypothetical protein TNCV_4944911 [Trichonephila clavipes]